jgi:hypothetical protein
MWRLQGTKIHKGSFPYTATKKRTSSTSSSSGYGYMGAREGRFDFDRQLFGSSTVKPISISGRWKAVVEQMRASTTNAGCEVLPAWGDSTPEQQKGENRFYCQGCQASVRRTETSVVKLDGWGELCADCAVFARHSDPDYVKPLSKEVIEDLEFYAAAEAEVYRLTIKEMSSLSRLDTEVIDYLLWRIPKKYIWKDRDVEDVQRQLRAMYTDIEKNVWLDFLWGEDPEAAGLEPTKSRTERLVAERKVKEADAPNPRTPNLFIACATHGSVAIDSALEAADGCPTCKKEATKRATTFNERRQQKLPVTINGRPQIPCVRNDCDRKTWSLVQVPNAVPGTKVWLCTNHLNSNEIALSAGRWRTDLVRWFPEAFKNCEVEKDCTAQAVATLLGGTRACHLHARGKTGTVFDNLRAIRKAAKKAAMAGTEDTSTPTLH